jgi:hypothetical protein
VHTGGEADRLAQAVDGTAFTSGRIYFRSGAYDPTSDEGMQLLAHEATHTAQQASGPVDGVPTAGGDNEVFLRTFLQRLETVAQKPSSASSCATGTDSLTYWPSVEKKQCALTDHCRETIYPTETIYPPCHDGAGRREYALQT